MLRIAYACTGAMTADEFQSLLPYVSEERRLFLNSCKTQKYKYTSLAGEVLARRMLSEEIGQSPESLVICREEQGKPYLKDITDLHFNISHSGVYVACAISDRNLGLDLQRVTAFRPNLEKQLLSKAELREYAGLTSDERASYLTEIWCKKESYYKLLGTGIQCRPCETDTKQLEDSAKVIWQQSILPEGLYLAVCRYADEATTETLQIKKEKLITSE